MNGNRESRASGHESSGTDDRPPTDRGVHVGPTGATAIHNPHRDAASGDFALSLVDEDVSAKVSGHHYADKPGEVNLRLFTNSTSVSVTLSPATARQLTADLDRSARGAEDPQEVQDA